MRDNSNINTVRVAVTAKTVAIALLAVLTVALFNTAWRFETVARNVLPNLDFSERGRYWQGSSEGVYLNHSSPPVVMLDRGASRQTFLRQSLKLPAGFGFLRIGADIRLPHQVAGPMWWDRAGILIYSIDSRGKRIPFWPSTVALPEASDGWRHYEAVIPVAPSAQRMDLYLFMGARHGVVAIRNLTVNGLENANWFAAARTVLAAGWVAAGLWVVIPLFASQWRRVTAGLALFVFLGTLAGVLAPQPELSQFLYGIRGVIDRSTRALSVPVVRQAPAPIPAPDSPAEGPDAADTDRDTGPRDALQDDIQTGTSARIIGAMPQALTRDSGAYAAHFSVHAALAFLILLTFRRTPFAVLFGYLLLTGASTEIIQYFVTTRTVNQSDGALNMAGIVSGAFAGLAWITMAYRVKRTA